MFPFILIIGRLFCHLLLFSSFFFFCKLTGWTGQWRGGPLTIFQIGTTLASIYARLAPPTIPRGRLSPPQSSNFVDGKKNRRKFHFFFSFQLCTSNVLDTRRRYLTLTRYTTLVGLNWISQFVAYSIDFPLNLFPSSFFLCHSFSPLYHQQFSISVAMCVLHLPRVVYIPRGCLRPPNIVPDLSLLGVFFFVRVTRPGGPRMVSTEKSTQDIFSLYRNARLVG